MPEQQQTQDQITRLPYKVVGSYVVVGALWILFSDTLLDALVPDRSLLTRLEILKGWSFLAVTGTLLYVLIRHGLSLLAHNNALLAAREKHYRMLFEKMENGFAVHDIIFDPEGRAVDYQFVQFNPGYENITGLKAEDVVGKRAREVFPGIEPFWIETYGRVARTGVPSHFGGYLKDLGRYFEVSAFAVDEGRVAVVCSDVTEKRIVETELKKLHEALEERVTERTAQYVEANEQLKQEIAQRVHAEEEISWLNADLMRQKADLEAANRELEAFSFSVSHDLRAPLRHIHGFTKILQEEHADRLDPTGRNYLDRITRGCETMGVLIDELLQLARITRSEMHLKKVNLSAMAEKVAEELKQSDRDRAVEFRIQPGVQALGDETLLSLVLQNLLGNAYKYTGKKDCGVVEFGAELKDGQQVFFVRDNGAGFDMRYAGKLFGAFQRLHRQEDFEGSGVGLAIVQRIVHRHGGHVQGEGVPDEGATFSFTLGG
ncbi:sensor histidine kinase [Geomesophilobacter sediminis]|uniref:histidine kinase n=1 Tax=Geomesophilobacter sediminis TaxID=2798584 RepID=A0A8J7M354_9BACT|nr:ATP-binding protein [Geomesophilobacter sediminis]MBJ6727674.1 PAS domain-containing protein [Geomesophilobacter sediminis]